MAFRDCESYNTICILEAISFFDSCGGQVLSFREHTELQDTRGCGEWSAEEYRNEEANGRRGDGGQIADLIASGQFDYGENISCNMASTRVSVFEGNRPSLRTRRSRSTVRI